MDIKIKNVGKIDYAEILLNGITVVAGENNTGKSTIGKTLFALLREMNVWEANYYTKCSNELYAVIKSESEKLEAFCLENTSASRRRTNRANELVNNLAGDKEFIALVEDFQILASGKNKQDKDLNEACCQVEKVIKEYCREYVALYQKNGVEQLIDRSRAFFDKWNEDMLNILRDKVELDEAVLQARTLKNSFNQCFRAQYMNVSADSEMSTVEFQDEGAKTVFTISKTGERLSGPIRTKKGVHFVESPKLFDEIGRGGYMMDPCAELRRLMVPNSFSSSLSVLYSRGRSRYMPISLVDSYFAGAEMEDVSEITDMLVDIMGGQAEFYVKEGIKFKERDSSVAFFSQNVSTGLKAMAFLEYAIRVGAIRKNDILILDEPEINLHPEWQVVYARALVLLQKVYNLTILITSHSPYFIRAIECLTDINNTIDDLNVYLVEKGASGKYKISNMMESEYGLAELYDRLSAPFDSLQEEINNNYSMG